MAFEFRESMINDYWSQGYVIFRRILPPSLLRDLRREADRARALAWELNGPQAQRLQPVLAHGERLDTQPFQDYMELPALCDATERLLGPTSGDTRPRHASARLGLLVEPRERPRHFGWHRDTVVDVPLADQTPQRLKGLYEIWYRPTSGNQLNCAIYPDPCLWYVPGSHARRVDLSQEKQAFCYRTEQNPWDDLPGSDAELEALFLENAYSFPGAVRVYLDPGDMVIYRNIGWHTGIYMTHSPRATLHDTVGFERPAATVEPQVAAPQVAARPVGVEV
jgi:hypothetical protein